MVVLELDVAWMYLRASASIVGITRRCFSHEPRAYVTGALWDSHGTVITAHRALLDNAALEDAALGGGDERAPLLVYFDHRDADGVAYEKVGDDAATGIAVLTPVGANARHNLSSTLQPLRRAPPGEAFGGQTVYAVGSSVYELRRNFHCGVLRAAAEAADDDNGAPRSSKRSLLRVLLPPGRRLHSGGLLLDSSARLLGVIPPATRDVSAAGGAAPAKGGGSCVAVEALTVDVVAEVVARLMEKSSPAAAHRAPHAKGNFEGSEATAAVAAAARRRAAAIAAVVDEPPRPVATARSRWRARISPPGEEGHNGGALRPGRAPPLVHFARL